MEKEMLVHRTTLNIAGTDYEVLVFSREEGGHLAKTFFDENDIIINDGISLEEALAKHERLLPLAVNSRQILRELRGS